MEALAFRTATAYGIAMWPFAAVRWRHWILLALCVAFLASYLGFISWGKVEQALERLADQPSVRERLASPIGRGEAIVTSFMFVLLTPVALAAAGGIVAFVAAVVAGLLRTVVPVRDLPDWLFASTAYVALGVAAWIERGLWLDAVWEFVGLIARALLIATQ